MLQIQVGTHAATLNGFSLNDALVPVAEVIPGGPPRDGIPALTDPAFVSAADAGFLAEGDAVLGFEHAGVSRAYPVKIMVWHEIVNDRVGGDRVAITYCPLCRSGVAFLGDVDGQDLEFGVSGLLHNSDMLMYDRDSNSLWEQIPGRAISGRFKGRVLKQLPLSHSTWSAWRSQFPDTRVLSPDTGYQRNYATDPYAGYESEPGTLFPLSRHSNRLPAKAPVLGLHAGGVAKAWPVAALIQAGSPLEDTFNGHRIRIRHDPESGSTTVEDDAGHRLPAMTVYWFAWFAFFPFTEIYLQPPQQPPPVR